MPEPTVIVRMKENGYAQGIRFKRTLGV